MEGEVLEDKKNILFNRREVLLNIKNNVCPSYTGVGKFISEKLSVPEENIEIKKVAPKFGTHNFSVSANVYVSKEEKENIEPKTKQKSASKQ